MRLASMALVLWSCSDDGVKVYNTPPSAALLNPPDGTEVDEGVLVTFQGLAEDSQDAAGDLQATLTSDLDGMLADALVPGTSGQVEHSTANLSPGNHAITLTVIDTDGETDEDAISLVVFDVPDQPEIVIARPTTGDHGEEGLPFTFRVSVSDEQDAPEDLLVSFASDLDGIFCEPLVDETGVAECDATLSGDNHLLTFTVTDTDGLEGTATFAFEVIPLADLDVDEDGWTEGEGDCDDNDPSTHPTATEFANGIDDDCDGITDEGTSVYDDDGDGQTEDDGDCDDGDDKVWLGAPELCDGLDNDCDLTIDEGTDCYDDDGDTWTEAKGDCDDTATDVHPGATETADGVDEDCDGYEDEGTNVFDDDGDCYCESGVCAGTFAVGCASLAAGDCDDGDSDVNPGETESCDGVDEDCDGAIDEDATDANTYYRDSDSDGYGDPLSTTDACSTPAGYTDDSDDCDDLDEDINPAETEVCDYADNDCDGVTDEGLLIVYYADLDGDTYGNAASTTAACSLPSGYSTNSSDCDDTASTTNPGADEVCDGVDNDCDTTADEPDAIDAETWYQDDDGDGWGDALTTTTDCSTPTGYVLDEGDCDDLDPFVNPDALEVCDGLDNNCDGEDDEDTAVDATAWYDDLDSDGYGAGSVATTSCYPPSGVSGTDDDCDDGDPDINPGETETCNSIDDNCDGVADDGATVTYYRDLDTDGYGNPASTTTGCSPPAGYVSNDDDCNDSNGTLNPETEWFIDGDSDTYGSAAYSVQQCTQPTGFANDDDDCKDDDPDIHPGGTESCNGDDDDCDGTVDEEDATGCTTYWYDYDGDGYGRSTVVSHCYCAATGTWRSTNDDDCYDYNSAAKPTATAYYTTARGDGSYDYNCDSSESKQYTTNYDCNVDWTGFACDTYTSGWSTSSDPACGSVGTWYSGCTASWFSCDYSSSSSRTQSCR